MAHTVEYLPTAHNLWPVHGQQGSQAEREKDPSGSNLTGYRRQPTGQDSLPAL